MKGGILTFHRNRNPGAVARNGLNRSGRACLAWVDDFLPMTRRFHDLEAVLEFVNGLDYVVIGSDEVWADRPAGLAPKFPSIYMGQGIEVPLVAYAASCGDAVFDERHVAMLDRFEVLSMRERAGRERVRRVSGGGEAD